MVPSRSVSGKTWQRGVVRFLLGTRPQDGCRQAIPWSRVMHPCVRRTVWTEEPSSPVHHASAWHARHVPSSTMRMHRRRYRRRCERDKRWRRGSACRNGRISPSACICCERYASPGCRSLSSRVSDTGANAVWRLSIVIHACSPSRTRPASASVATRGVRSRTVECRTGSGSAWRCPPRHAA